MFTENITISSINYAIPYKLRRFHDFSTIYNLSVNFFYTRVFIERCRDDIKVEARGTV